MSFFKKFKDSTDERFHRHLPDSEHSQNDVVFTHTPEESPDAALIMDRLNSKETPASMRALLQDQAQLQTSGQQLKEIFLECIFSRARKSLEHLKRFVELFYVEIFDPWFVSAEDALES